MITHRPETLSLADRIVFLDRGRVVEEGSCAQLLAKKGAFATMFGMGGEQQTVFLAQIGRTVLMVSNSCIFIFILVPGTMQGGGVQ